jgi:asparagine synthase (glutamine-hydrolysing)
MPHLDVQYVTREGKSVLSGLEQTFMATDLPAGSYHFVMHELLSTLAGAGATLIMDGHGGDYTLHPRGQAALARFLATLHLRRFFSELRGHLRLSGHSAWTTLKIDIAAPLLPRSVMRLWHRIRHGANPAWDGQPINSAFADRLVAEGAIDQPAPSIAPKPPLDMRAQILSTLQAVKAAAAPGLAGLAALHRLEVTRPFHDKRVVELALAIPQDLYVKNGRNRYLACAALKDVYPTEFQTRWRKNDDEIPDFQRMAKSIEPEILAEVNGMERLDEIAQYVDFAKIRRLLAAREPDDHNSGWEEETQRALHGFVVARYLKWLRRHNR